MANLFDYLMWRGDLALSQSAFNDVDSLILSTFSYVFFDGIVPESLHESISLEEACQTFRNLPKEQQKVRDAEDKRLLRELLKCRRF